MATHLLHCQICLTAHPVLRFKFFPCGHGFCTPCTENIFLHSPKCPHCRVTLRRRDAHVVYIDIASPEEHRAALIDALVDGFAHIDQHSELINVENAGKQLDRFVKGLEGGRDGQDTYRSLLQAVEDFKKRIIPDFRREKEQATEMESLKTDLDICRDNLAGCVTRIKPLEREVDKMRSDLSQIRQERDQAIGLAGQASDETIRLRRQLAQSEQRVFELEEKTERYKGQLIRHSRVARTQTERIELLEQESANQRARQTLENGATRSEVVDQVKYSMTQSYNLSVIDPPTPPRPPSSLAGPLSTHTKNVRRDFEAMPPPGGFRSDWQIPNTFSKKRKHGSENEAKDGFPLSLDTNGRPTRTVQLGTRRTLRVSLR